MNMTMKHQMELTFGKSTVRPYAAPVRPGRYSYWVGRMRHAVDRAMDWERLPAPRPEQIVFPALNPAHSSSSLGK
jgi:hypothetical protein